MKIFDYFDNYNNKKIYPFHMPGHKRIGNNINQYDYTEVENLDNLYHSEDILLNLKNKISGLYGVKESLILVNGSTCGILTAITSSVKKGDEILVARNCHKAVYNAIELWNLHPHYILPEMTESISLHINPADVEKAFENNNNIKAFVLTSPTYEGVVSDIEKISKICHRHNAVLIVDEAHGSHMKFCEYFPKSAVDCGADLVIQSTHKTLTSLTGTAVLHICTDRVDSNIIKKRWQTFQTSSPNYIMMASMDECFSNIENNSTEIFNRYTGMLDDFYCSAKELSHLKIFSGEGAYTFDKSKIVISTSGCNLSGTELQNILRENYNIETEMSSLNYVIAMTSINDTAYGFGKLNNALVEIDRNLLSSGITNVLRFTIPEYVISGYETENRAYELVPLENADNRISSEYIYAYPPGIPIVSPGERISKKIICNIKTLYDNNVKIISDSNKLPVYIKCTIDT